MTDRFDQIRIKPDLEKDGPDKKAFVPDKDQEGTVSPNGPVHDASVVDSKGEGSHFRPIPAGNRKRPPFRPGLVFWLCALPVLLVFVYGAGSYFLVPMLLDTVAAKSISTLINRPVTVNRVIFSPFSLKLYLTDITVGAVYGDRNDNRLLECDKISGRLSLLDIFNRQLIYRQVEVDGLSVHVQRSEAGAFNITQALEYLPLGSREGHKTLWPRWLVLDGVNLVNSRIIVDDTLAKKQHRLEEISFYIPPAGLTASEESVLPSLNAVINSSPVRIDGIRRKNIRGEIETSFNLKLTQVLVKDYLDYLPIDLNSAVKLIGGQADIDLNLVIPEMSNAFPDISLQGNAVMKAVMVQDITGRTVLQVPQGQVTFRIMPAAKQYDFATIVLDSPKMNISVKSDGEREAGEFSFSAVESFFTSLNASPYGLGVDKFQCNNGTIAFMKSGGNTPVLTWDNVAVSIASLKNRSNQKYAETSGSPAAFTLSGKRRSGGMEGTFSIDGTVQPGTAIHGAMSFKDLDLKQYADFLPPLAAFHDGIAEGEGTYEYAPAAGSGKEKSGGVFLLRSGSLSAKNFSMFKDGKNKIVTGKYFSCQDVRADTGKKNVSCGQFAIHGAEIYADMLPGGGFYAKASGGKTWNMEAGTLDVRDSTIYSTFSNPLDPGDSIKLTMEEFSLKAGGLTGGTVQKDNVSASGKLGEKGKFTVNGSYMASSKKGEVKLDLRDMDVRLVKGLISPWFKLDINEGLIQAQGTYSVHEKKFSGKMVLDNLSAGREKGASMSWQRAISENMQCSFDPLTLRFEEILVKQLNVIPGLSNSGNPADIFLKPLPGKTKEVTFEVGNLRLENGRYILSEPVVYPGYQPEVSSINGTVTSHGAPSGLFLFSLDGRLDKQSSFSINGTTGFHALNSYSLNVRAVPLAMFQAVLADNAGLDAGAAFGNWNQAMEKENDVSLISSRLSFYKVRPQPGSQFAQMISLLLDNESTVRFETKERLDNDKEQPFLLESLFRFIQRGQVKAELSDRLVLKELLPDLILDDNAPFAPGTTILMQPTVLSHYGVLLKKRPYLKIELKGCFDQENDMSSLQESLQQQEDMKREAVNLKRDEERKKREELEKARLAELMKKPGQVVEEKIQPQELALDLLPIPPVQVTVTPGMLDNLARERAESLKKYFVNQLLMDPDRVTIAEQTGSCGSHVQLFLWPYFNGK